MAGKQVVIMTQPPSRLTVGILFVALLTVTAGCMALVGDDPDPEQIAEELDTRHDQIDDIQGVQVVTVETADGTERTVTEVVEQPPAQAKHEIIETDSEWQSEGDVMVMNDGQMTNYDAAENTVTEFEFDFEFDADPETMAVTTEEMINQTLENSEIEYEGTDTVADRSVYVLEMTDTESDQTTTLSVDQEYWYPLKTEMRMTFGDTQQTVTMTYDEIAFNEGVADDAFEFEPPADATVEEFEMPESQTFESVTEADASTDYDVVEPELPDAFDADEVRLTDSDDASTVSVEYTADDEAVRYSMTDNTDHEAVGDSIEIGSTEGTVTEFGDSTSVLWDCDGIRYTLGGEVDREMLVDGAASIGC